MGSRGIIASPDPESAKEFVTTHLPKQLALKMDGAKASYLYSAVQLELALCGPDS